MKRYVIAITLTMALILGVINLPVVSAAGFDDPNLNALHESVADMRARAAKGDPQAQTGIGMINYFGLGAPKDLVAARGWFEKAADQGYPEAMVQLGNLYENGMGVERDLVRAAAWYQKGVSLNSPHARFRLGLLNLDGIGVAKNEAEGRRLLRSACDDGHQTSCGVIMLMENNIAEARVGFNQQCQAGDQLACDFLAQLGPTGVDEEVGSQDGGDKGQGGVGIYLVIGLVLVGLLIFWLIRNDPGDDEEQAA